MTIQILDARFVITAVEAKGYPKAQFPEIAFVGRSNVGKSSMINALANRRKLVRVSNTPGRTRTINFFDVDLERDETRRTLTLADLPGYGFAKASKGDREQWKTMIGEYLEKRDNLKVIVQIVDAEVGPTSDDFSTLDYLQERKPRILVAATKIDRLGKAQRKPRLHKIAEQLEVPREAVLPFSATDRLGVDEMWQMLLDVAAGA